jgi:hypothetical protein
MNFENMYPVAYPTYPTYPTYPAYHAYPAYPSYPSDLQSNVSTIIDSTIKTPNIHNMIKNVANDTIYRNRGWFNKAKTIVNYLHKNVARCFQCYDMIEYKEIVYSRILNYCDKDNSYNNSKNNKNGRDGRDGRDGKDLAKNITNQNIIGNISCLCKNCVNANKIGNILPKTAPKSYSDILADYILNERFDLISDDIEKLHKKKMDIIDDRINYLKFNINEKKVILNNLINQNNKLSNNIELEIEKYKILNEQHIKNKELCESIKHQLLQLSIDLFKENKKLIEEQINKYNDLNNCSKYSIPECKICMMNEINIAIQCGHVFCIGCYNQLLKNKAQNNYNNRNDDDEQSHSITCPTCRTESNTYIQLYL